MHESIPTKPVVSTKNEVPATKNISEKPPYQTKVKNVYEQLLKNKYKLLIVSASLFVLILIMFSILQRFATNYKIKKEIEREKAKIQTSIQEEKQKYEDLLNKKPSSSNSSINDIYSIDKRLIGNINLLIIYCTPDTLNTNLLTPLINTLNSDSENYSTAQLPITFLGYYIENEARNFQIQVALEIEIIGPYKISNLTKVGDLMQHWGKDPFAVTKLMDVFKNVAIEEGVDIQKYDAIGYVYFDNSFDLDSEADSDSFYEYKKFRSFSDSRSGQFYVNVYDFEKENAKEVLTVVIHEFLHIFGANDKYLEVPKNGKYCNDKSETGDPNKADIMCLLMNENGISRRADIIKGELVINEFTAEEIGWAK